MSWSAYNGRNAGAMDSLHPDSAFDRSPSRSMGNGGQGHDGWDRGRRMSTPIRWHPEYNTPENQIHPSPSTPSFRALETIEEDMPTPSRLEVPGIDYRGGRSPSLHSQGSAGVRRGNASSTYSDNSTNYANQRRRHSDGDILELSSPSRYNKKTPSGISNRRVSRQESGNERPARRKGVGSLDAPTDLDAFSEVSDVYSTRSGKSRLSTASEESLSSASKLANRRKSEADAMNMMRKTSSTLSLVRNEARRKSSSGTSMDSRRPSVANGVELPKSQSERRLSALTLNGGTAGDPSPFATLEIPVELLETPTSRARKLMAPIIMFVLVMTLLASLAVAVYFAVVLKDTQEQRIAFLEANLKFSLAKGSQSRDFSRLTDAETEELRATYCRQIDELYKTSNLYTSYRGCELDTLTNDRIEFKLYFLDSLETDKKGDDILEVLASRAQQVGQEGSQLRQINDVTLDLSEGSRSVDIVETQKPEDFFGADSPDLRNMKPPVATNSGAAMLTVARPPEPQTTTTTMSTSTTSTTAMSTTTMPTSTTSTSTVTTTTTTPAITVTTAAAEMTTTLELREEMANTVLNEDICMTLGEQEIIANPTDCTHYIQCEFGKPIVRPCSGGLVFNPANGACVIPSPDLACSAIAPCDNINGGHFAHPTNCQLFIICDQGKAVVQSCQTNMMWDNVSKNCVIKNTDTNCTIA